jgi:hypothetical protein
MEKSFGIFIRDKRLEKGFTLRKFAAATNISPSFISMMERDECQAPGEDKIKKIAEVLNVDEEQLTILAGRLPEKVKDAILKRPTLVRLLRVADSKTEHELKKIIEDALK